MNRSVPIEASGVIPVSESDVKGIPEIALSIPDFEGQAILRIFSNSSKQEIGCYSGVITNGASFSHPSSIGTIVGLFVLAAAVASIFPAIYGSNPQSIRRHYAHSVSVYVIFAVLQHVYFTGALSLNWPSVLVAFWSNFAWSGGIIYGQSMQESLNHFIGQNQSDLSDVATSKSIASLRNVEGMISPSSIYKRGNQESTTLFREGFGHRLSSFSDATLGPLLTRQVSSNVVENKTQGVSWYGSRVGPGLPVPGNFSGFAGTLSQQGVPTTNAFLTGFLWLLITLVLFATFISVSKLGLELLDRRHWMRPDRMLYSRGNWTAYLNATLLRILHIGFFAMLFLSIYQFAISGPGGVLAIASFVFLTFLVGAIGFSASAYRHGMPVDVISINSSSRLHKFGTRILGGLRKKHVLHSQVIDYGGSEKEAPNLNTTVVSSSQSLLVEASSTLRAMNIDPSFLRKYGWLTARYKIERWWVFGLWLTYDFIRACLYGGATNHPRTQVIGLLTVEIIAFCLMVYLRPFEGQRLNALMIYLLGGSKILTLCLSAAFDCRFNLPRIKATVIGIVIIVIQGLLICAMLIVIVIGCVSSYMSVTRGREDFKPVSWATCRNRYLDHVENSEKRMKVSHAERPEPQAPHFRVTSIYRHPKIEDEDSNSTFLTPSTSEPVTARASRTNCHDDVLDSQSSLPFGAKVYRASWRTQELEASLNRNLRNSRHHSCTSFTRLNPVNQTDSNPTNNTGSSSGDSTISRKPVVTSEMPKPGAEDGITVAKTRVSHNDEALG